MAKTVIHRGFALNHINKQGLSVLDVITMTLPNAKDLIKLLKLWGARTADDILHKKLLDLKY